MGTLQDVDNALAKLDTDVQTGIQAIQAFVVKITGPNDFAATVAHVQAIDAAFNTFIASLSPPTPAA